MKLYNLGIGLLEVDNIRKKIGMKKYEDSTCLFLYNSNNKNYLLLSIVEGYVEYEFIEALLLKENTEIIIDNIKIQIKNSKINTEQEWVHIDKEEQFEKNLLKSLERISSLNLEFQTIKLDCKLVIK